MTLKTVGILVLGLVCCSVLASIPGNSVTKVYLPTFGTLSTNVSVTERGVIILKNGTVVNLVPDVTFDHAEGADSQTFIL